jgi:cytochrome b6-f complex iron-sulfur subunit
MADFTRRAMIRTAALVPLAARIGCARRISTNRDVAVPAAVDGDVTIALGQAPELSKAGGAVIARPQGDATRYLVANSGTGYLALRATCPHEGCDVAWVAEDRQAECPCHGSRFAGDGTVLNPPAITDLAAYPAEADAQGNVIVHLFAGDGTFANPVRAGKFSFAIADFPVLANMGGIVLGRPSGFPSPLLVTRLTPGTGPDAVGAVSAVCSHLGCTVLPGPGDLQCPCHESAFDLTGKVLREPATTNLLRYAVEFDGITVVVSTTLRS